ncbi:tRNA (adenosine(37)-N6)-threonylcarbamoyltransferase complex ATPase subunit type 1 TsaE [Prosthecodimorpha staleyi]|uniref:tRNA threonylcarbamoyladenosine biosynthesis protein TsaE n=1 Tax=Prosthecodimorpha staleyi TaxID=2840188 RepID=A0A947D6G5_9HYPH|nr:tRNA (adenosine(37)-N6)-threonylcarbamoyltransferase complex ATPase subunit type 1 TsaE [Prosthecodimorpha staleyi]MBT9291218.1 tRNA (adenosine(37)-N6)-threonylcarbamoyltransferase complex ATPase subunit type 1 TsaE [Prosthecodimorpha staleyi]
MIEQATAWRLSIDLADEAATVRLAEDIAAILRRGDVIALDGDLGAGKTTWARALIRALAGDAALEVPSPTFTLVQSYALPRFALAHFDLYRLGGADEMAELGLDEALADGAALVEWPERAEGELPMDRLTLALGDGPTPDARVATLSGPEEVWRDRIERTIAIRTFLSASGWGVATRRYLQGDASARAYERLAGPAGNAILMNQPAETDDAAGQARRGARAAAKLAEDTRPFHAFALGLGTRGFSVPTVRAHDPERGFMLLEDLGNDFCVAGEPPAPIPDRYRVAVAVLARLHGLDLPAGLDDGCGGSYAIPAYDRGNLTAEVSVFLDWGLPHLLGRSATPDERDSFLAAWSPLFDEVLAGPATWCLRDYHSPNLLWLPDREGHRRIGILDFQDTILGHPAYDLVSIAQDARVTVPPDLEAGLLAHYLALRTAADPAFDAADFRRAYAILSVQRNTRILGVFARLKNRDGKPGYMRHYPRLWDYLDRSLREDVTLGVKLWYDAHVPEATRLRAS